MFLFSQFRYIFENVTFYQLTGTPLTFAKRLQFNLEMKPIPNIEWMKSMPNVIFPLFWAEESVCLDKEMTGHLKNTLFL